MPRQPRGCMPERRASTPVTAGRRLEALSAVHATLPQVESNRSLGLSNTPAPGAVGCPRAPGASSCGSEYPSHPRTDLSHDPTGIRVGVGFAGAAAPGRFRKRCLIGFPAGNGGGALRRPRPRRRRGSRAAQVGLTDSSGPPPPWERTRFLRGNGKDLVAGIGCRERLGALALHLSATTK